MSGVARTPSRSDLVLAAVLTVLSTAELYTSYAFERVPADAPSPLHLVIAVIIGSALAWRRVLPLLIAPAVLTLISLQATVVDQPNVYGEVIVSVVTLYSLAVYAPTVRAALVSAGITLAIAFVGGLNDPEDAFGTAATNVVFGVVVVLAGFVVRRQRDRTEDMQRQRDLADQRSREIAASERARIARELHDVVAHGMSVVVLQARGGRRVVEVEPARARRVFDDIERVAADCLDEMRRLLGILRAPTPTRPRWPLSRH